MPSRVVPAIFAKSARSRLMSACNAAISVFVWSAINCPPLWLFPGLNGRHSCRPLSPRIGVSLPNADANAAEVDADAWAVNHRRWIIVGRAIIHPAVGRAVHHRRGGVIPAVIVVVVATVMVAPVPLGVGGSGKSHVCEHRRVRE